MNLQLTVTGEDTNDLWYALGQVQDAVQQGCLAGHNQEDGITVGWSIHPTFIPSLKLAFLARQMVDLFSQLDEFLADDAVGCPNPLDSLRQKPSIAWLANYLNHRTSKLVDEFLAVLTASHQNGRLAFYDAVERHHVGPE